MDDLTLARALLSRDRWAPKEAWQRFTPMVRAIVVRRLGFDSETEDLTQEIFYRLFAKIGLLQKPEALRQFVASFAIRIAKWEGRRRRQRTRITLTATGALPERPVEDSRRYDVFDALRLCDRLISRERDVLFLRHVEGMTLPEIARTLGLSLATIKRILQGAQHHVSSLRQ